MNNLIISVLRTTIAPLLVGVFAQFLVLLSVEDPSGEIRMGVMALAAAVWYLFARFLQIRWPQLGFLLIVAARPHYTEEDKGNDLVLSVQRTFVPLAVGWAISLAAKAGLDVDDQSLSLALQGGVTTVYYGILRWIEAQTSETAATSKVAGTLLGGVKTVTY